MTAVILTDTARARLWRTSYRLRLHDVPNSDVAWERDQWRRLNAPMLAGLCERELCERAETDILIPGETPPAQRSYLWRHVDQEAVLAKVHEQAMPLVEAACLWYWERQQERPAA